MPGASDQCARLVHILPEAVLSTWGLRRKCLKRARLIHHLLRLRGFYTSKSPPLSWQAAQSYEVAKRAAHPACSRRQEGIGSSMHAPCLGATSEKALF